MANISHLPAGKERLEQYRQAQKTDPTCSTLRQYCRNGWPNKEAVTSEIKPYWQERGNLTIGEDLLLHGSCVVVPALFQKQTIQKLHQGHQGVQRCRLRANSAVWWPGISCQISDFISRCPQCCQEATPRREPLISTPLPDFPWQKAATDLFELEGSTYLVVVDYFSRYPEVIQLRSTTSRAVIQSLKGVFGRHGIPEVLLSDNGPQYHGVPEVLLSDNGPQYHRVPEVLLSDNGPQYHGVPEVLLSDNGPQYTSRVHEIRTELRILTYHQQPALRPK